MDAELEAEASISNKYTDKPISSNNGTADTVLNADRVRAAINKVPAPKRLTALEQAHAVIYGEREKTYGNPGKNLRVIADYWSTHLNATYDKNIRLTTDDVCVMMILLKQARQANTPGHADSIVDTIGYAALQDRVNNPVTT